MKNKLIETLEKTIDILESTIIAAGNLPDPEDIGYYGNYWSPVGSKFICVDIPFHPDHIIDFQTRLGDEWAKQSEVSDPSYLCSTFNHAWLPGVQLLLYAKVDVPGAIAQEKLVVV